ncbi:hypothetical protein H4219_004473 [Mycoemilia scoparia]|uniref:CD2 antigen cytoplasmic tail-binding protein 2 n=1 Tax=Mycoemilia scoparia TaxID=417184 RepID=A0A9W7ZX94_9FUNG|nr:hypothetical protein H4219_004473 [Mycoemilia scoparia]
MPNNLRHSGSIVKRPRDGSTSGERSNNHDNEKRVRFRESIPGSSITTKDLPHDGYYDRDEYSNDSDQDVDEFDILASQIQNKSKRQLKGIREGTISGKDEDGFVSSDNESVESDDSDRQFHKTAKQQEEEEEDDEEHGKPKEKDMDIDMFGESDISDKKEQKDRKSKRKMRIDEIEGQEFDIGSSEFKSLGAQSDSADSDDSDDNKGKNNKERFEAFNMKSDYEEGHFDETGNFVWNKKDSDAIHDIWLDGVKKKDIKKAMEAENKRQQMVKEKLEKQEQENRKWTESDVLIGMAGLMKPGETVLNTMTRFAPKKSKNKWGNKNRRKKMAASKSEPAGEQENAEAEAEKQRKENVELLTDYTNRLTVFGRTDVYDLTFESIIRQLRIHGVLADNWMVGDPLPDISTRTSQQNKAENEDFDDMFQD